MWRLGRLILSLPLLAGCASAPEGVLVTRECSDPDGYMIREEVVPDRTDESIRGLADYYDALFPVPSALSILFSSDLDTAWIFGREIGLPGLEARAAGFADDRERVVGKHAHFRRVREGDKIIVRDFNRLDP